MRSNDQFRSDQILHCRQKTVRTCHRDTEYVTSDCDPHTRALIPPLHFSTTFERDAEGELSGGYMYSRLNNPTREYFEQAFTRLEKGGGESMAFSSGMQAASAVLQACPGAHVLLPDDLYHGVYLIIADVFAQWGMTMEKIDFTDHAALLSRLQSLQTTAADPGHQQGPRRLVLWMETPSNPLCKVTDVQAVSALARNLFPRPEQLTVVVDSTWATPYLLSPLQLGADFVLHSVTKYVAGHSDVLGGVVTASSCAVKRADAAQLEGRLDVLGTLRTVHQVGGGVCGPMEAWLAARGLRTLPLRLNHQCQSALRIAEGLEGLPWVSRVFYPGLVSHPQHALAAKQMRGRFGGMLSLLVRPRPDGAGSQDGGEEALRVSRQVRLFKPATSLGGTESLLEHRRSVEGAHPLSPPALLRLSVGLESADDLLEDLTQALRAAVGDA